MALTFEIRSNCVPTHRNNTHAHTGATGASAKERCLSCFSDYPQEFTDVVRATPAECVTEHGYYRRAHETMPEVRPRVRTQVLLRAA